uniref:EF-hand domain-containing protein n=1 Tax=Alexandrium catenella TaxID=2925 RepID=A0A7S1MS26_ALECA|mmetsp:Transcript_31192/g.84628  ORF Transcript_31192/g.84628 Transcript_31192/m.84628 type:complete len:137 (+) Transcript_31192:91-501(+)
MPSMLRRLALAVLMLVGSAEGGVILNTLNKAYASLFGPKCDAKCMDRVHAIADMLIKECDEDADTFLSRKEWGPFMQKLFLTGDEETHEREYQIFVKSFNANAETGVPAASLRFVFKHESWRTPLERWVSTAAAEL